MELCEVKPVERAVEIKHPSTGDELGITVTLMSMNDPRMSAIKRRFQVQRLEQERRRKAITVDEIEKNTTDLLVASMTGWVWKGDTTFHGEKPAFNEEKIKEIFKELPWFKDQITEALEDEKSFFQN